METVFLISKKIKSNTNFIFALVKPRNAKYKLIAMCEQTASIHFSNNRQNYFLMSDREYLISLFACGAILLVMFFGKILLGKLR